MYRVTGPSGLTVGTCMTTLMLLAAGAGPAFARGESEAPRPGQTMTAQAAALAAVAATGQDPDAPPAEAPPPADDAATLDFFRQITISGLVDGYYQWAFNEEPPGLRSFDMHHNSFSLSYAEVALEKAASEDSRAGFRVDFGIGDTADIVNSFEPGGDDYLKFVQQAYVSYLAPVGTGLTIDFGKFVTVHGAEVIEAADNYNYSRGILFGYAIPFYHMGFRVGYSPNEQVEITGLLVNGWNNVRDNNSGKTVGISVAYTPNDRFSFTQQYMVGPEADDNSSDLLHLFDTLVSYELNDRTSLLANFDFGRDTADGTSTWYGLATGLQYRLENGWAIAPRYEIFKDEDGWATGQAQTVQSFTLTAEKKIGNFISRYEWRSDFSNEPFFADGDALKKSQSALIVGLIYTFSSR